MYYELTKPQKQIVEMERFIGGTISVIGATLLRRGETDPSLLQSAINELIRIHDSLRVRLVETDGTIKQQFQDYYERAIPVLHFTTKKELDDYAVKAMAKPIDLWGELFEFAVVVLPDQYGIFGKFHHVIADAWTVSLLGSQFFSIADGQIPDVVSYREYCVAEREYMADAQAAKDRDFFLSQLNNGCGTNRFSEKKSETLRSARKTFLLKKELIDLVKQYTEGRSTSLLSLFMVVFAVYYSRIAMNPERVYLGTTLLNRLGLREKEIAGMFVNTVPVLLELNNDRSFRSNHALAESEILSVLRHQQYNYGELQKDIRRKFGDVDRLFDVMVNYQNAKLSIPGEIESTWYPSGMQLESLQIHIEDFDQAGVLRIHYDYQTEKFTEKEIERLHDRLCGLLEDVLRSDDKKLRELDVLTSEERQKCLVDFNRTAAPVCDESVYALFERQALAGHGRIRDENGWYTTRDLMRDAEKVDCAIRAGGKRVIGLLCDRSYEELAAIYGIVRGGNAYLPISPEYPEERIRTMLESSGCKTVLVQRKYASRIDGAYVIEEILSREVPEIVKPCAALSTDALYVIFTSGSTGKPKGAMISNRSAVNRIRWMAKRYFDRDTVVMLKTPYTFDVSVWEIFGFGTAGFSLYILPPEDHYRQDMVLEHLRRGQVTDVHFVPAVFSHFLEAMELSGPAPTLKNIFLSGEALTAAHVNSFHACGGVKTRLHNLYGPTECAVDVTYYDCAREEIDPIPIGRPIDNCRIYVLDPCLQPVPIGVTGQICIAGLNVGEGYILDPERTAERFVEDPFSDGRMYLSGDLGYWREDGELVYVGRNDQQVKINGQRVELGEIEAALSGIDGVSLSAVRLDSNRLTAFYTGDELENNMLRRALEKVLPRYMIPHAFVHLAAMPLNSSGKIDRRALPAENTLLPVRRNRGSEPVTEEEKVLAAAVGEVLSLPTVGMLDNFFELGGDSISAIYVITMLQDQGYELTAADFLRSATLEEASARMVRGDASAPKRRSDLEILSTGDLSSELSEEELAEIMRLFDRDTMDE